MSTGTIENTARYYYDQDSTHTRLYEVCLALYMYYSQSERLDRALEFQDIFNQLWLEMFRKPDQFSEQKFEDRFKAAFRNKIRDLFRKSYRMPTFVLLDNVRVADFPSSIVHEIKETIVNNFNGVEYKILYYRLIEDKSFVYISDVTGISQVQASKDFSELCEKLRVLIRPY